MKKPGNILLILLWCVMLAVLILRLTGAMMPSLDLRQISSFAMFGFFTAKIVLKEKPLFAAIMTGVMVVMLLLALLLCEKGSWCQPPTEGELIFSVVTCVLLAVVTPLWLKMDKLKDD